MDEYEKDKTLKKAKKEYEDFAGGDAAYWAAEAELKARLDRNSEMYYAKEEAKKEGREEGLKEGIQEGIQEGKIESKVYNVPINMDN